MTDAIIPHKKLYQPRWASEPLELPTAPLPPLGPGESRTTLPPYWCDACKEPRPRGYGGRCSYCSGELEHVPELAHIAIIGLRPDFLPAPSEPVALPKPKKRRSKKTLERLGDRPLKVEVTNLASVPVWVDGVIGDDGVVRIVVHEGYRRKKGGK